MLRIKDKDKGVPDQYRYTHKETGWVSRGASWREMWSLGIGNVVDHRKANGLPPVTEAEVEDQICRQIPPDYCNYEEGDPHVWVNTRIRFSDVVAGTKEHLALLVSGETASQEEANRRAKICSSCYFKILPTGCASCVKLSEFITGSIATKKTSYDAHLTNLACAVCSCSVKSIVHFPMSALDRNDSPDKQAAFPAFCWRKQGGENRVEEI